VGEEMPWNVPDVNHSSRNNKQIIIDEKRNTIIPELKCTLNTHILNI